MSAEEEKDAAGEGADQAALARAVRQALGQSKGPLMKVAQLLSTIPDLLPQAYAEGALIVAERLRARIAEIQIPGFGSLSASLGIATFPSQGSCRQDLVVAADSALYTAKRTGRNRVCIFEAINNDGNLMLPAGDPFAEAPESIESSM